MYAIVGKMRGPVHTITDKPLNVFKANAHSLIYFFQHTPHNWLNSIHANLINHVSLISYLVRLISKIVKPTCISINHVESVCRYHFSFKIISDLLTSICPKPHQELNPTETKAHVHTAKSFSRPRRQFGTWASVMERYEGSCVFTC